jgi:O-antigen/teichoic acid export membrane protein
MNIQRIAKQFAASATSQVIILLQQLLLPPIFIHFYGVSSYADWLTLSASVGYLSTLQFGMQTYVNNELTMRYSRGEMDQYQVMQSTALRMLLGIAIVASLLLGVVFFLPLNTWMRLPLSQGAVATAVFFLGLQVIANLPLNYFSGTFMVFGKAHRGTTWQNILRTMMIVVAVVMALMHSTFQAIAIGQFVMVLVYTVLVLFDLRRLEPTIFPTLRYWDSSMSRSILGPSGYFFLLYTCNFLVYQLPILLIRRILGPLDVVIFNVTRSIFSMIRQGLAVFTNSLGPEVTSLFGRRDWTSLANIYSLSEKLLFAAIPTLNFTTLLMAPVLLQVWLHKPNLYSLTTYAVMTMCSCAIAVKDHKMLFQVATNHHREMARNAFVSYVVMIAVSFYVIPRYHLVGFLLLWFVTEFAQTLYILWLNTKLLEAHGPVDKWPVVKMLVLVPLAAVASIEIARHDQTFGYVTQACIAISFGLILFAVSAWLFRLRDVVERFLHRRAREQAIAASQA